MNAVANPPAVVTADERGDLHLGPAAAGQMFVVTARSGGLRIVSLDDIPADERWVYENPEVLAALLAGLAESARGEGTPLDLSALLQDVDESSTS